MQKLASSITRKIYANCKHHKLNNNFLQTTKKSQISWIALFINMSAKLWLTQSRTQLELANKSSNLVRKLYHLSQSNTILSYSLPKIDGSQNRLVWHHSSSGEYQVKKTYYLLHIANRHNDPNKARVNDTPNEVQSSIWKVNCQ